MSLASYQIEITQTLQCIVTVEADSLDNTLLATLEQLNNETIVLDHNDCLDTQINLLTND